MSNWADETQTLGPSTLDFPSNECGSLQELKLVSFHEDKIPKSGFIAIQIRQISLKRSRGQKRHTQVAGEVTLVREDGELILLARVNWGHETICQYFPAISGLDKKKLEAGFPLSKVHKILDRILEGNVVVGVDPRGDLEKLHYYGGQVEEFQSFYTDTNGKPYNWMTLAEQLLGCDIHYKISSENQARIMMNLHKYKLRMTSHDDHPYFLLSRTPRVKRYAAGDYCIC